VIIQVTTHYTKFSPTCKLVHSKVTYSLRAHQFTVRQGKEAKNVIIQVTTHYTKFNLTSKHVHSKVTYVLRVHQFTVRYVGKGGKECDHSSYHSLHKIQSYVQTCPFKGNLLPESATVHSTASGERRQKIWSFKLSLTT